MSQQLDDAVELFWPRHCFNLGNGPVPFATSPIELAGPPHVLFFGPYIPIPVGAWTATIGMAFSADALGNALMADVYCDGVVASVKFAPKNPGFFAISLDFRVTNQDIPVEVRAFSLESCLEGRLSLGGVILDRRMRDKQ